MFSTIVSETIQIDPDSGCWIWLGYCDDKGYGHIQVGERNERVHRLVYRLLVGPIPMQLTLDHLCLRTSCCNPAHLEVVTRSENSRRLMFNRNRNSAKTHCPQNHPYDDENTHWRANGKHRGCRTCMRDATRRNQEKQKAERLQSRRDAIAASGEPVTNDGWGVPTSSYREHFFHDSKALCGRWERGEFDLFDRPTDNRCDVCWKRAYGPGKGQKGPRFPRPAGLDKFAQAS